MHLVRKCSQSAAGRVPRPHFKRFWRSPESIFRGFSTNFPWMDFHSACGLLVMISRSTSDRLRQFLQIDVEHLCLDMCVRDATKGLHRPKAFTTVRPQIKGQARETRRAQSVHVVISLSLSLLLSLSISLSAPRSQMLVFNTHQRYVADVALYVFQSLK